ncbi:hypothetical protein D3C87_1624260 [compost metagenome]
MVAASFVTIDMRSPLVQILVYCIDLCIPGKVSFFEKIEGKWEKAERAVGRRRVLTGANCISI